MSNELLKIRGILMPCNWDEEGTANHLMLTAAGEIDYLIDVSQKKLEKLQRFCSKEVVVEGWLKELEGGKLVLKIKSLKEDY